MVGKNDIVFGQVFCLFPLIAELDLQKTLDQGQQHFIENLFLLFQSKHLQKFSRMVKPGKLC